MLIVIQYTTENTENDLTICFTGTGKACSSCKTEMKLILQEAEVNGDEVEGWWYCDKCGETDTFYLLKRMER